MQSGKLRHLTTIEQPSAAVDLAGQDAPVWSLFAQNVWCQIKAVGGVTDEERGRSAVQRRFELKYRYMELLSPDMRITTKYKGISIIINIEAVNPDLTDARFMIVTGTQEING